MNFECQSGIKSEAAALTIEPGGHEHDASYDNVKDLPTRPAAVRITTGSHNFADEYC